MMPRRLLRASHTKFLTSPNWLFAGNLRAGKRAATIMSLVHSVKMDGLDAATFAALIETPECATATTLRHEFLVDSPISLRERP
jgi:hypothetical protein